MILDNKKIAIIGGGPGGLIVARLLLQKEIDVKVGSVSV
jgi:2-polyprenyl-6-methoxyphenol hydroxylase-like FAD-dependent oxidoreductase